MHRTQRTCALTLTTALSELLSTPQVTALGSTEFPRTPSACLAARECTWDRTRCACLGRQPGPHLVETMISCISAVTADRTGTRQGARIHILTWKPAAFLQLGATAATEILQNWVGPHSAPGQPWGETSITREPAAVDACSSLLPTEWRPRKKEPREH